MSQITKVLKQAWSFLKEDSWISKIQAILLVAAFPLVGQIGLAFRKQIEQMLLMVSFDWSKPISDFETIQSLWLGAASIHAAVGAVAPILGYTLFATNMTSASRIAPAGAVIANEIRWSAYLRSSLLLLTGSLLGLITAPSLLGMAAAYLAAGYVVLRTLLVFKRGFTLFERPEKFDASARKYLRAAIADVDLTPSENKAVKKNLANLNESYAALPKVDYFREGPRAQLVLGDRYRATQLLDVEVLAIERLSSEAEKNGYILQRSSEGIPDHLDRGVHTFVSILRANDSVNETELPESNAISIGPDPAHVANLQQLFQSDIVFGSGPWTDDITRLPMLAQRHVATVLYEAMPGERPHDLEYGLEVLSEVIDAIDLKHKDGHPYTLGAFDWVTGVPAYLVSQAVEEKHGKALYKREIAHFLRSRYAKWVSDPHRTRVSRSYMYQLAYLLRSSLLTDINSAQYLALVIREIPSLARNITLEGMVGIQRSLLNLVFDRIFSEKDSANQRKLILATMRDSVRYGPRSSFDAVIRAETIVATLAVGLYQAKVDSNYKLHVEQVLETLIDRHAELPFFELLEILKNVDEFDGRWDLSGWEIQQKDSDEAHWVSIHIWITNAVLVALSSERWRLSHLEDSQIPNLQVISNALRSLEGEQEWLDVLPEPLRISVLQTIPVLQNLRERRQKVVDERVAEAGFSVEMVRKYVQEVMEDISVNFGAHNGWLLEAGAIEVSVQDGPGSQAGVSKLVPKEWFVSNDLLDIPVHLIPPKISSALLDFEMTRIARVLTAESINKIEASAVNDSRIWDAVRVLIEARVSHLLILAIGVSEYDVWELLQSARAKASSVGVDLRFQTVRSRTDNAQSIVIVDATKAFTIVRSMPAIDGVPVHQESLRLVEGGVVSGIIRIDEEMILAWKENLDAQDFAKMKGQYLTSFLDRTVWCFEVVVRDAEAYCIFSVSMKE